MLVRGVPSFAGSLGQVASLFPLFFERAGVCFVGIMVSVAATDGCAAWGCAVLVLWSALLPPAVALRGAAHGRAPGAGVGPAVSKYPFIGVDWYYGQ